MSKKLDLEMKKAERDGAKVKELEAELTTVTKDRGQIMSTNLIIPLACNCLLSLLYGCIALTDSKDNELKKLKVEVEQLGLKQGEVIELSEKVKTLESELKDLNKEAQRLTEAYQTERVSYVTSSCIHIIVSLLNLYSSNSDSKKEILQHGRRHERKDQSLLQS